jgi:hypothetical protein
MFRGLMWWLCCGCVCAGGDDSAGEDGGVISVETERREVSFRDGADVVLAVLLLPPTLW